MSRPGMRFAPIKSAEQQATLALRKTRELLMKQRTMSINALRKHLAEFGLVAGDLIALAADDATLPRAAKQAVRIMARQIEALAKEIQALEKEIAKAAAQNELCGLLDKIPGGGSPIASATPGSLDQDAISPPGLA